MEGNEDGLVLEAERGRHIYRIPDDILLGLEVSRGRNHGRGALQGLGLGILGGGVLFGGMMAPGGGEGSGCIYFCSAGSRFLLGAAVGGVVGGGLGLVVGAAVGTHRWEQVW